MASLMTVVTRIKICFVIIMGLIFFTTLIIQITYAHVMIATIFLMKVQCAVSNLIKFLFVIFQRKRYLFI